VKNALPWQIALKPALLPHMSGMVSGYWILPALMRQQNMSAFRVSN
jgi:hypothetical protein